MKCGELGFKNASGDPCGQIISASAKGCLWHLADKDERRAIAMLGGVKSRLSRLLPKTQVLTKFTDRESVIKFAEEMSHTVLTRDVDPTRVATALKGAAVALSAISAATQEELLRAILKLESGQAAVALLTRLQEGVSSGRVYPLPSSRLLSGAKAIGGEPS